MSAKVARRRTWSNRVPVYVSIFTIMFLFGAVGVWSATAKISGAVIGKGRIQVSSNRQVLQHPVGGVISEVLVANGDVVNAGQVVLRLDNTQLRTKLKITEGELYELLSNEARLEAEIDGTPELTLHPLLEQALRQGGGITKLVARQKRHLASRLESMDTSARLLGEQINQVKEQIVGVRAELAAKVMRKAVVDRDLKEGEELLRKGLTKRSTVRDLEKDHFLTLGEIGKLTAKVAELKGKISELKLKMHALGPANQEKAITELGKLRPLKTKLMEQRIGILDVLSNLEIRTPVSGTIHDSQILGLRSVVVAAKPLMYVVPNDRPISVAVRLDAADIDQIYSNQNATIKFTGFSRRSTPMIQGTVIRISADALYDDKTRKLYYDIEIALPTSEIAKLGKKSLIPGMPVRAFIATKSRSPLNYVTRPLVEYFDRAFRDS